MIKNFFINNKQHLFAIALLYLCSIILLKPLYFDNKSFGSHDKTQFLGMSNSTKEYIKKNPKSSVVWNRNMFSGMPNYMIGGSHIYRPFNVSLYGYTTHILKEITVGDSNFYFLLSLGFYLFCIAIGTQANIAFLGALLYTLASNTTILFIAGHETKLILLGYFPYTVLGVLLIHRKQFMLGLAILIMGMTLINASNHIQLIYYAYAFLFFLTIAQIYIGYIEKEKIRFLIQSTSLKLLGFILGTSLSLFSFLQTKDYSQQTIRGGSALSTSTNVNVNAKSNSKISSNPKQKQDGLSKEYAFVWSYKIGESFMLAFPYIYGGSSGGDLDEKSKTYEYLIRHNIPENQALPFIAQLSTYWGSKPFTAGPIYLGVVAIFIFFFSIFYLKSKLKIPIYILIGLMIMHSWGKYFSTFNYFLFDNMPFFNKFRDHSMVLSFLQFLFAWLCIMVLQQLSKEKDFSALKVPFKKTLYGVGILFGIGLLLYLQLSYTSKQDANLEKNLLQVLQDREFARDIMNTLREDRASMFFGDLIKYFILTGICCLMLWRVIKKKLQVSYFILGLIIITFIDLFPIDKKYLKDELFFDVEEPQKTLSPDKVDQEILQDPDNNYRVFDQSVSNPFSNALPSAFHRNIGGYHAAKLSIYQDLIARHISKNNPKVLNMLNTKYIIYNHPQTMEKAYTQNPNALGACWLVDSAIITSSPMEAINMLDSFDEKRTVVLEKEQMPKPLPRDLNVSEFDYIRSIHSAPDTMIYESQTQHKSIAVFSEVFYAEEWKAFVDNKTQPILKANYVLRALVLNPGKHTIKFIFYSKYDNLIYITKMIFGNLIPLFLIFAIARYIYLRRKLNTA